jgi:UDP-N-acetylglucosamine 2-epimerase (non-hydrolysing)
MAHHVMLVAGARPNFIKVAPVLRALDARGTFRVTLIHTGQHYDEAMSGGFFRTLGIPEPDVNLNVGSASHASRPPASWSASSPSSSPKDPPVSSCSAT